MPSHPRETRLRDKRAQDGSARVPPARNVEAGPERTPIWVAGSQQPKFNLRAWGFVGQALTRRWLGPRLDWAAEQFAGLGSDVTAGRYRIKTEWMGRASRIVPSHLTVGAIVTATGNRMQDAREILLPRPAAPEPVAYPNLIRADTPLRVVRPVGADRLAAPKLESVKPDAVTLAAVPLALLPAPSAPPQPARPPKLTSVEPTLTAIRAVIHADPTPAPATPARAVSLPDTFADSAADTTTDLPPDSATTPRASRLRPLLARATAHAIAWGFLTLSLPIGLVQATLYHLNGGDLADWD